MLHQHAENLWTAAAPLKMMGLHLGTRMTVVRLQNGSLLLHSPVSTTPEIKAAVDELGSVSHIVCPNVFHHLYAGDAAAAWPDALLHGPAALERKRRDLKLGATLQEKEPHPDWQDALKPLFIGGCMLKETVFLHEPSGTVISSDLLENFQTSSHFFTRCYLKISGVHGKVGWSKLLRWVYRDRAQARADLGRILEWDFDRIILAHGDVIDNDGPNQLRRGMDWLLEG
ncbi:MAG: DUF4336 domain-containing protein [Acidobacteriota bacterium]|nr:DUF4336 domain-containing protein [Acidobacteriota bacterium]